MYTEKITLHFTKKELYSVLENEAFTPEKLVEFLRSGSGMLDKMYTSDAGVWEKYTIAQHTIMMMSQFERYFPGESFPGNLARADFRLILALHDIGKPLAIADGDKNNQHQFTMAIMKEIFEDIKLSDKDKKNSLKNGIDRCPG